MIILLKILSLLFVFLFLFPINAYSAENTARSAIVIDASSKTVLYEKNAYEARSIASTTKIMTALLAVESNRLNEVVTVEPIALDTEGSSLGLCENDKIILYDLVVGMMLTSGNDSANAVAVFLTGSIENFSKLMNNRAKEIGMDDTYFVTPSGLDEGNHHSTAYDMALLTAAAIENNTFCEIVSKQSAEITINSQKKTVYNHNKLLSTDKNIFGVKTGYTDKAGRCLVSAEKYKGNKVICVTLSCPDDWNDHVNLLNECEKKYKKVTVKNNIKVSVVGGNVDFVSASYSIKIYTLSDIKVKEYYKPFVYASVKKGDKIGEVFIYKNNKLEERLPIEADEDVKYYDEQQFSKTSKVYG